MLNFVKTRIVSFIFSQPENVSVICYWFLFITKSIHSLFAT